MLSRETKHAKHSSNSNTIKLQNNKSKEHGYTSSKNLFAIVQWAKLVVIK